TRYQIPGARCQVPGARCQKNRTLVSYIKAQHSKSSGTWHLAPGTWYLTMPVSTSSSRLIYDSLKAVGVRLMSALPETWLVHLIRMAEEEPEMILGRPAQEAGGGGHSDGAHH